MRFRAVPASTPFSRIHRSRTILVEATNEIGSQVSLPLGLRCRRYRIHCREPAPSAQSRQTANCRSLMPLDQSDSRLWGHPAPGACPHRPSLNRRWLGVRGSYGVWLFEPKILRCSYFARVLPPLPGTAQRYRLRGDKSWSYSNSIFIIATLAADYQNLLVCIEHDSRR